MPDYLKNTFAAAAAAAAADPIESAAVVGTEDESAAVAVGVGEVVGGAVNETVAAVGRANFHTTLAAFRFLFTGPRGKK